MLLDSRLKFWHDNWMGRLLVDVIDLENRTQDLDIYISKVTNFDGSIVVPDFIHNYFLDIA